MHWHPSNLDLEQVQAYYWKRNFYPTDNILLVLNQEVEVIFHDLAIAFDCVNHEIF